MSTFYCENVDPMPLFTCADHDAESNSFASDFDFSLGKDRLPYDFELKWDANAKAIKLVFKKATETSLKAVVGNDCASLNIPEEDFVGKTIWFTNNLQAPKSYVVSLDSRSIQHNMLVSVTDVKDSPVRDYRIRLNTSLFFGADGEIEQCSLAKFRIEYLEWGLVPLKINNRLK